VTFDKFVQLIELFYHFYVMFFVVISPPGSDSLRSGLKFRWHLLFFLA